MEYHSWCHTRHIASPNAVEEARVGVQAQPQKLWFVENPGKIPKNMGKFSENRTEKATNVVWFQKIAPIVCRKTREGLFLEIIPKKVFTIFVQ